jgi:DNA-binding response OmpR family regulator
MNEAILSGASIFLANDNYNTLIEIKSLLEEAGYRAIDTFANGNELLFQLENKKTDLIISDICMPQVDGFQLLREIKSHADKTVSTTPVILYSAMFNDFETRKLANELGADNFFNYPFDAKSFLAAIDKALHLKLRGDINAAGKTPDASGEIKIVILEDDKFSSRFLLHALKELDYKLFAAESIAEFDEIYEENKPQICIIDYNLPDGDGIEVLKKIKSLNNETKVIMMTAITNERMIDDFIKEGADNFINKPINVRNLIAAIKNAAESIGASINGGPVREENSLKKRYDFSPDYQDIFNAVPAALAVINQRLDCLIYNAEFGAIFKLRAKNPRLVDDNESLSIEAILSDEETEKLKIILEDMAQKKNKIKQCFTFSGPALKGLECATDTMFIKSAEPKDVLTDDNIFYISLEGMN